MPRGRMTVVAGDIMGKKLRIGCTANTSNSRGLCSAPVLKAFVPFG